MRDPGLPLRDPSLPLRDPHLPMRDQVYHCEAQVYRGEIAVVFCHYRLTGTLTTVFPLTGLAGPSHNKPYHFRGPLFLGHPFPKNCPLSLHRAGLWIYNCLKTLQQIHPLFLLCRTAIRSTSSPSPREFRKYFLISSYGVSFALLLPLQRFIYPGANLRLPQRYRFPRYIWSPRPILR